MRENFLGEPRRFRRGAEHLFVAAALCALAAASVIAADSSFTLGIPGAPVLRAGAAAGGWLSANPNYPAMSVVAPAANAAAGALSASQVAGEETVLLRANEAGFPVERTKPEYYLGDVVQPPPGVDWPATYARFRERSAQGFLFDPAGQRVFVTAGGTLRFDWVLTDGSVAEMSYVTSPSCSGRPRRIYWTDYPYNGPSVDLSGKFVKFFGPDSLIKPTLGVYTNSVGGIEQVITNHVVTGLWLDQSTRMLNAYGQLEGQVVMAYYDSGTYEKLLHVQAVEICRPQVNVLKGEIGRALKPDGRGYGTAGLRARPTIVSPTDDRGEYLYQHKGRYAHSPKNGCVYPLRPTADCRWKAEIYWMETDEMEVQWPFELDQYECDWPADATVFARGDVGGDTGRPIYVPSALTGHLMEYQEPDGHAKAVASDGTFETTGEGWSLLRLTTDDDIWFVPLRSVFRSNRDFFTLAPEEIAVGRELRLRGGRVAGTAAGFSPACDPDSPGYIYAAASGTHYNPRLYKAPQPEAAAQTNQAASASSGSTNSYDSVIYAVSAKSPFNDSPIEVWWNTTIREEGMPAKLEVPTLPQVYSVRWPKAGETPQIVIASQLGAAAESLWSHNSALYLDNGESTAALASRDCFGDDGGTVTFWYWPERVDADATDPAALLTLRGADGTALLIDAMPPATPATNASTLVMRVAAEGVPLAAAPVAAMIDVPLSAVECGHWISVALRVSASSATLTLPACGASAAVSSDFSSLLVGIDATLGAAGTLHARAGVNVGELLFWNAALSDEEIAAERLKVHTGPAPRLSACYSFVDGEDLVATGSSRRTFTEKVVSLPLTATECLVEEAGPPALGTGVIVADADTTPSVYVQNDLSAPGYNPNEEHAIVTPGSGGHIAWALRSDLNTDSSSVPGVLVEYAKGGRKAMQWFDVAVTNSLYPELAADCTAGLALPGPHPIDMMDNPWCKEDKWDEPAATSPAFRDRKGQLWARAAGDLHIRMYYPMQEGFAFPAVAKSDWPAVGKAVPWLSLLGRSPKEDPMAQQPAVWLWRCAWPENPVEIEIGRTLTVAASGLPEVWNAKSMGVVWPATDAERDATAVLFDPTVAQRSGFTVSDDASTGYETLADAIAGLGIKTGSGGNATLRKGRYYFDGLPPTLSSRFYLDTTADLEQCLVLEGEMEDNLGGVELLHVNVPNAEERKALESLLDDTAGSTDQLKWRAAIAALATAPVRPSSHKAVSATEEVIDYQPRDHYALFTMGATNYITLVENDSENELMGVADGDPIQMRVLKVVPRYYVGRVVTREDPINLLSQQLSVIYAEAFAGKPEQYVFEWRNARPNADGSTPVNPGENYSLKFPLADSVGKTRFTIGGQGDTLANMVNTYYAVRYRAASASSPAYAAMGEAWSDWTTPPCLAEGWVQRVLNNVTPFAQRMRDLAENRAETPVSMIRQAGGPYEGPVALNQDNLAEVGLIQLYETLLAKAESMSLSLGIDDTDANKQLQLAAGRLADLYNLLGDEAYTDALNPTIGFGSNFDNPAMTGFELDYGTLSSALFAFDNQVPTLLDEELALLRGRSGADSTGTLRLSPYYNRLVWNFTRGITAGEVAYAVNYDISGNNKGIIDYQQAAEMFPQGHGDAYGHYLSALSGYYRLLRNPFFTWGPPAMGEMVVADAPLNVDYYDEAAFAKAAQNVAKTALAVVDRTARKAYRDNGGAPGAGYLDTDPSRAFGYGEWAARGGYGALANWVVANSLLPEAPTAARFWRHVFDGDANGGISPDGGSLPEPFDLASGPWTVEFQLMPDDEAAAAAPAAPAAPAVVSLESDTAALGFVRDATSGALSVRLSSKTGYGVAWNCTYWLMTNAVASVSNSKPGEEVDEDYLFGKYTEIAATNGTTVVEVGFFCPDDATPPVAFPAGFDFNTALSAPPSFEGYVCAFVDSATGEWKPYRYTSGSTRHEYATLAEAPVGTVPGGSATLVALIRPASGATPVCTIYDQTGALLASAAIDFSDALGEEAEDWAFAATTARVGAGFCGQLGEVRIWDGIERDAQALVAKRDYVSPLSDGLAAYLRCVAPVPSQSIQDEADSSLRWRVSGGAWASANASGMALSFDDKGLKRIDRGSVAELSSLAAMIPAIQKKLDQLDAGMNPLGLASGAIPFDLTPIGLGDGESSHFEQIRDRAKTAMDNARKALDRAQSAGSRLRLLQEEQTSQENHLETIELEFKNTLIEYFGYPYQGDIGPGGTYAQGYDGPDLVNYMWMDPSDYGASEIDNKTIAKIVFYQGAETYDGRWAQDLVGFLNETETKVRTNDVSATGIVVKPASVTGRRRAQGKIQDAMGEYIRAYSSFKRGIEDYDYAVEQFKYEVNAVRSKAVRDAAMKILDEINFGIEMYEAAVDSVTKQAVNSLEIAGSLISQNVAVGANAAPRIVGAGLTVNSDPGAIVNALTGELAMGALGVNKGALLVSKNALVNIEWGDRIREIVTEIAKSANELLDNLDDYYTRMRDAAEKQYDAAVELDGKWKDLQDAMRAVETVVAEAERVIDERTLARTQAVDSLTKARYNEMFFRLARNNALARYDDAFALAQKYVWLAAQAYDYETGLLSSDPRSGEKFLAEIVGARTLGEFDDGEPAVTSGDGDGGLADILARMDANWLVLKPRLGLNNPQGYATWFSLRKELFRIYGDARGDKAWRTALRKCVVQDLNSLPEFTHYCQPLAGATATAEPGLVIPFGSLVAQGYNFFGKELAGGDASLDPTWFATRVFAAGVHFEGYDPGALSRTPTAYLVPVGEDRMRAVGDPGTVLSWHVVDQTIPAPFAIGSAQLDDPDWTPLYTGATGGNDFGARIRRHPSFRAYYDEKGRDPSDDSLDCSRLVGRSAWNTRWLLIIPASSLSADRDAAISAFIDGLDADRDGDIDSPGVSDIMIGLKTYSTSGN